MILAIVLSVVLIKRNDDPEPTPEELREPIGLNDILRGVLQPKRFNGTWVDDTNFYFFDSNVILNDDVISFLQSYILIILGQHEFVRRDSEKI